MSLLIWFRLDSRCDLSSERLGSGAPCDLPCDRTLGTIVASRPSLQRARTSRFARARCSLLPDPATIMSKASRPRMETP